MKIAYIVTKSYWGGAQKYVYDCATHIKSALPNAEVSVLLGGNGLLKEKLDEKLIKTISVPHLERDINIASEFKVATFLYQWMWHEKPDVVHLNSSKIGGLGALIARLVGIPKIIFTAHGWAFNENRSELSKAILHVLYWFTIVLSHKTICVSEKMREQIKNYPLVQHKVVVIRNGIEVPHFLDRDIARNYIKSKITADISNRPWVINIGELHPIKGHAYLIDAALLLKEKAANKNISPAFFIVSDGELKHELSELIKQKGLENDVFLLGYVPQAATYLKAADLFVVSSLSEGLGYVAIEAGFAQLPVIATNVGGLPEIIENEKTGLLIEAKSSLQIAAAIEKLLGDEMLSQKLAANLYQKVTREFSIDQMIKETAQFYTR